MNKFNVKKTAKDDLLNIPNVHSHPGIQFPLLVEPVANSITCLFESQHHYNNGVNVLHDNTSRAGVEGAAIQLLTLTSFPSEVVAYEPKQ